MRVKVPTWDRWYHVEIYHDEFADYVIQNVEIDSEDQILKLQNPDLKNETYLPFYFRMVEKKSDGKEKWRSQLYRVDPEAFTEGQIKVFQFQSPEERVNQIKQTYRDSPLYHIIETKRFEDTFYIKMNKKPAVQSYELSIFLDESGKKRVAKTTLKKKTNIIKLKKYLNAELFFDLKVTDKAGKTYNVENLISFTPDDYNHRQTGEYFFKQVPHANLGAGQAQDHLMSVTKRGNSLFVKMNKKPSVQFYYLEIYKDSNRQQKLLGIKMDKPVNRVKVRAEDYRILYFQLFKNAPGAHDIDEGDADEMELYPLTGVRVLRINELGKSKKIDFKISEEYYFNQELRQLVLYDVADEKAHRVYFKRIGGNLYLKVEKAADWDTVDFRFYADENLEELVFSKKISKSESVFKIQSDYSNLYLEAVAYSRYQGQALYKETPEVDLEEIAEGEIEVLKFKKVSDQYREVVVEEDENGEVKSTKKIRKLLHYLKWGRVPKALGYRVTVSKVKNLSYPVVKESTRNNVVLVRIPQGRYYWQVEALRGKQFSVIKKGSFRVYDDFKVDRSEKKIIYAQKKAKKFELSGDIKQETLSFKSRSTANGTESQDFSKTNQFQLALWWLNSERSSWGTSFNFFNYSENDRTLDGNRIDVFYRRMWDGGVVKYGGLVSLGQSSLEYGSTSALSAKESFTHYRLGAVVDFKLGDFWRWDSKLIFGNFGETEFDTALRFNLVGKDSDPDEKSSEADYYQLDALVGYYHLRSTLEAGDTRFQFSRSGPFLRFAFLF